MSPPTPPEADAPVTTANSLAVGTRLAEFELRGVLGEGGFATVYRATDHSLRRTVAIKEYMPGALATRAPDGSLLPREAQMANALHQGLQNFLNEARLLAQFDHPALIRVYRFWEQNRTAYMAMQLCQGRTLRELRQAEPKLVATEQWLRHMLSPILDALELLHSQRCYHRDISPDNIMILDSGVPMLLDFGAARQSMGDATQALTVIVKPGFAPIEQYDAVLEQGPWTDVYSLGAVLHFLVTGQPLTASVSRLLKDPLPRLADAPGLGISPAFARAIDRALTVHPDERIRSVAEFREALELPTFWAEMHRQSVELGALRSRSGSTHFGALEPLAESGDTGLPEASEPAPFDAQPRADAAAPSARNARLERLRRELEKGLRAERKANDARAAAASATLARDPARAARRKGAPSPIETLKRRLSDRRVLIGAAAATVAGVVLLSLLAMPRGSSAPGIDRTVAATSPAAQPAPPVVPTPSSAPPVAAARPAPAPPPVVTAATPAAAAPAGSSVGANLMLDVSPWGVVYVDGAMQGLTPPLKQIWLQPGPHTIEVRNAGLPSHTEKLTIQAGKDVTLRHEFE